MIGNDQQTKHRLLICTKCQGHEVAARFREALQPKLPKSFSVRAVECLAGCDFPTAIGYQAEGKASYLFGGIDSDEIIDAIVEFAHQYEESDNGWTSSAERPLALYDKTLARLPTFNAEVKR